jgi:hypothetical protein
MNAPPPPNPRARWIALLAVAALAAGVGVAYRQSRPAGPPAAPSAAGGADLAAEPGEDMIAEALRLAPGDPGAAIDSTAYKQRWLDNVRGVDLDGLDAAQRERFIRFANARQCTCGCGFTLATCRESDMTCDVSTTRLAALLDSIRAGHITSTRGIRARPHGGG